jgi:HEAT repeat protein
VTTVAEAGTAQAEKNKLIADEAKPVFDKLRKGLKQVALYRHNVDRYGEYLAPFVLGLQELLQKYPMISVKVDPVEYKIGQHVIFEDESRESNLIYPLWQAGIRLLIFKNGVSADELQRFFLLCMSSHDEQRKMRGEDINTQLWKAELENIEYVVVEGFKAVPDDDIEDVEVEVEKVVAYLYRQLQSNSDDYLRFARVSQEDLELKLDAVEQVREGIIEGVTATAADKLRIQQQIQREEARHLTKMVVVLFQLLELDTTEENFEDVAEAFVQLLDALLLAENFAAIDQIRARFKHSSQKPSLRPAARDLIQRCELRFVGRMGESQRVQAIGQILNQGLPRDANGIRNYLYALGVDAIPPLIDMLETLQLIPSRRLVCDVLAELGKAYVETFAERLNHPSSNLVKDMIYVIDKINPAHKFSIFASVLEHPNAILRLETLAVLGRNGSDECFEYIAKVIKLHPDPQMRSQAARMLPNFPAEKGGGLLLEIAKAESFDKLPEPEKKALFAALVQMNSPNTEAYIRSILDQKSGLLAKKRVDDLKLLAIGGIEAAPSIPGLQLLAQVAQDPKKHSKDVVDTARAAAINMKARLLGGT